MNIFYRCSLFISMMLMFLMNLNSVSALSNGEIIALKDMQAEWGTQLGWTGSPSCSWYGITCDSNRNVINLMIEGNQLRGKIPDSIGGLVQLEFLYLYDNQLIGTIPDSIGNLVQLRYLWLYSNQLSGMIPDSIGNLVQLQSLYLFANQLSGTIPDSIGNLDQLQKLALTYNQLSGTIPDSIGNLVQLQYLWLNDNQLNGTIPDSIGNLVQLQDLYLSANQLSGTIPDSIESLFQLQRLSLYNNLFSGVLPQAVCSISIRQIFPNTGSFLCPLPTCCPSGSRYCSSGDTLATCSNTTSYHSYCCYYASHSDQPAISTCAASSNCPPAPERYKFFSSTPMASCSQCSSNK